MSTRIKINNSQGGIEKNDVDISLPINPTQGSTPIADSSLSYIPQTASPFMRNRIINGAMMVDQRNNDKPLIYTNNADAFPVDRWRAINGLNRYSVYFDGTGDYLSVADNAAFQYGTGDFTIESWIYATTATVGNYKNIYRYQQQGVTGGIVISLIIWTDNKFYFEIRSPGITIASFGSNSAITTNQWYHIAIVRRSGTIYMFVNGIQQTATASSTHNITAAGQPLYIGCYNSNADFFVGYISNLRAVKGTALYTANFTPSTVPLSAVSGTSLLTCATNTISDGSSNAFAVTAVGNAAVNTLSPFTGYRFLTGRNMGWSNYFDGSGDYLSIANNAALNFGSGDFTFESWIYLTGDSSVSSSGFRTAEILSSIASNGAGAQVEIFVRGDSSTTGTGIGFFYYNGTSYEINQTRDITVTKNVWHHVAICRTGSTVRMFFNGTQLGASFTSTANIATSQSYYVGGSVFTGYLHYFTGHISNLRIVKGTALYTANFTPQAMPLIPVENTSLLTCASEAFNDKSSNNFAISPVGNATISSYSPFSAQAPSGFISSLRWSVTNPASALASETARFVQRIESASISDLAWGTAAGRDISVSFWVRSSIVGTYCVSIQSSGGSYSHVREYTISSTNTWEKKTFLIPSLTIGGAVSGYAPLRFDLGSGSNFNTTANAWQAGDLTRTTNQTNFIGAAIASGAQSNDFCITGVQFELGSVATPFEVLPAQVEIALCQRYYAKMKSLSGNYVGFGAGWAFRTTDARYFVKFPTNMRANPQVGGYGLAAYDTAARAVTSVSAYTATESAHFIAVTSGLTATYGTVLCGNNNPDAYVEFDAEL